jgi:hypothetical protein
MSIHEHLPPQDKAVEGSGLDEGAGASQAGSEGQVGSTSIVQPWLHEARQMPKEEFKQEVERELTGKEDGTVGDYVLQTYPSQIPVIERAIEPAALMLGCDRPEATVSHRASPLRNSL